METIEITQSTNTICSFTEKDATALVVKPAVVSINPETLSVIVQVDAVRTVEAVPFQWGGKMLMKVVGENTLTQGEKISVGQLAKKAIRAAGLILPTAELKRPRKNTITETPTQNLSDALAALSFLPDENV